MSVLGQGSKDCNPTHDASRNNVPIREQASHPNKFDMPTIAGLMYPASGSRAELKTHELFKKINKRTGIKNNQIHRIVHRKLEIP